MKYFSRRFVGVIGRPQFDRVIKQADSARDQGHWSEAAALYGEAVALSDDKAWAWVQYAHALKESGALKQAVEAYERAVGLAPEDPDPVLHLAHLLKRLGEERAIEQFRRLHGLTGSAGVAEEINRLLAFHAKEFADSAAKPQPALESPALGPENVARLRPAAPAGAQLAPGLYRLSRGARLIAWDPRGTKRHKVRLIVDGEMVWSGCVTSKEIRADGATLFDIPLSFPEPSKPTDSRLVIVEAANVGLEPSGGRLEVAYSTRFSGVVQAIDRTPTGCVLKTLFSDSEGLTTKPFVRALRTDGTEVTVSPIRTIARKNENGTIDFECHGAVPCSADVVDELTVYPMWSTSPLEPSASAPLGAAEDRLVSEDDFQTADSSPIFRLDWVRRGLAEGWANIPSVPEAKLVVDILHGEDIVGSGVASRFHPDLAAALGTSGTHAYEIEIAPGLPEGLPLQARVRSPEPLALSPSRAVPSFAAGSIQHHAEAGALLSGIIEGPPAHDPAYQPSVAAIILNQNGAPLLRALFDSIVDINTYDNLEIIVVDHNSSDDSSDICDHYSKLLNIRFVDRGFNGSFSSSNNFGVSFTEADVVFFLNNDTVFIEDILTSLVSHFRTDHIQAVGVRLVDRWSDYLDGLLERPADQHLGVFLRDTSGQPKMYELRGSPFANVFARGVVRAPAVTAAAMLMRRVDFLAIGGFDERYFYGHEDVDLCLRIGEAGGTIICDNRVSLAHLRGFSRARASQKDTSFARTQARNREIVYSAHARGIHRRLRKNLLARAHLTAYPVQLTFLVTSLAEDTLAGDVFTAQELAASLAKDLPSCDIRFVAPDANGIINVDGADIVISMRDDFDVRKYNNLSSACHVVFWVRNNFDRFIESDNWQYCHDVWYSSEHERARFEAQTGVRAQLLRIATNWDRFAGARSDLDYASDYCFTGSRWGMHREITVNLVPDAVAGTFRAFGAGWNQDAAFAPYAFGSLRYNEMPQVYASTRVVIDDANHVTISSGSVNSRVFDAIAAGALPVTNGLIGAREAFGGALPTYSSAQELHAVLSNYLGDEEARLAKVAELQVIVRREHTYDRRARDVVRYLRQAEMQEPSVAIKIAAPKRQAKDEWGDYHYAEALRCSLARLGVRSGIFFLDEWDSKAAATADVSLVLRGLNRAKIHAHQINLLWLISHPDKVCVDECRAFDHVFAASDLLARDFRARGIEASLALQCTDTRRFRPDVERLAEAPEVLFVGNSRGVMRPIVSDAIAAGLDINVFGEGWNGLIPSKFVKGTHIPNEELPRWYASAGVVLNDHWPSMSEAGLVSNRVFDILAAGGCCISDNNSGIAQALGSAVQTYSNPADLRERVQAILLARQGSQKARLKVASMVGRKHSFDQRASQILAVVKGLMTQAKLRQ